MSCVNPKNQMIYQALLNKAATYPPDQYYKATAYKYAAESVLTQHDDLRYNHNIVNIPYIGRNITKFIEDFNNHPCSISFCSICEKARPVTTSDDVFASDGYKYAAEAMETARITAAQNAPKHTAWSNDDAERTAFQARLAASNVHLGTTPSSVSQANQNIVKAISSNPIDEVTFHNEITNIMAGAKTREEALALLNPVLRPSIQQAFIECVTKNSVQAAPSISDTIMSFIGILPSNPPENLNTSESLVDKKINELKDEPILGSIIDGETRRSSRLIGKPKVQYHQDDDLEGDEDDSDETYVDEEDEDKDEEEEEEDDEVTRAIKRVCAKNQWPYSDDIVTDYNDWYPTARSWETQRYNYDTNTYTPMSTDIVFKNWAKEYSAKLKPYYRMTAMKNGLIAYCNKHGYKHSEALAKKFIEWASNTTNTTRVYNYADNVKRVVDLPPTTVVTKWFKTLEKTIIF